MWICAFKKVSKETKNKDNYLINIGNRYIVYKFGVDKYNAHEKGIADRDKILNNKVFSEIPKTEPYFLNNNLNGFMLEETYLAI